MKELYIFLTLCSLTIQGQYHEHSNVNSYDTMNPYLDEKQRTKYANNNLQQDNTFSSTYVSENLSTQQSFLTNRDSSEIPVTQSATHFQSYGGYYTSFNYALGKTDPKPIINNRGQFPGEDQEFSQNVGSDYGLSAISSGTKTMASGDINDHNVRKKGQMHSSQAANGNNGQDTSKNEYPREVTFPNTEAGALAYLNENQKLHQYGEVQQRFSSSLPMPPNYAPYFYQQILDSIQRRNQQLFGNSFAPANLYVEPDLDKENKDSYNLQYRPSSYNNAQAVQTTNNWGANQSNNKNYQLVPQDSVNGNVQNQYDGIDFNKKQTPAVNHDKNDQASERPKPSSFTSMQNQKHSETAYNANRQTVLKPMGNFGSLITTTPAPIKSFANVIGDIKPVTVANRGSFQKFPANLEQTNNMPDQFPSEEELKKGQVYYQQQLNNIATPINTYDHITSSITKPNIFSSNDQLLQQNVRIKGEEFNASVAIGNFGLKIIKSVRQQKPSNWVISPMSITLILALLQQGAVGDTQYQLSRALGMSPEFTAAACKSIADDIKLRRGHNILNIANSIFGANKLNLSEDFARKTYYNFDSEIIPLDFYDIGNAASTINGWVSNKTNHTINRIVSEESLSPLNQLVLVNAMYFKGIWQMKFKPETTLDRDFYINNVEKKKVPFLRARRAYKSGVDSINRVQVVILPFEQEQYSMMVLLPLPGVRVDEIISTLTYGLLADYHNYPLTEVELEIPKFSTRSDTNLAYLLKLMNVTKIFSTQSDLSGIGYYGNFPPQVSSAIHTAQLAIDETGGTAEAATAFSVVALAYEAPSTVFKANRPFISILWDTNLALPLFIARIEDPSL